MATKTEIERLSVVETKVDAIQNDVTEVKKNVSELVDKLDTRFAAKWTERVVAGMVGLILTAFITMLTLIAFNRQDINSLANTPYITRTTTTVVNGDGTTTKTVDDGNGNKTTGTEKSADGATPSTTVNVEQVPSNNSTPNGNTTTPKEPQQGGIRGLIDRIIP